MSVFTSVPGSAVPGAASPGDPGTVTAPDWSLTQKSPQAAVGSGTLITPTFAAGTTTGNLLVAVLAASAAGTWSLPAGWVAGPDVSNGGNHSTIWYYIGNPGAITGVACTYSVAANIKGAVAEFHTDIAGAAVVANALGTATAGTVAACPASTSTGAAAGDLAVCSFFEHLSAATAVTWTDPSGWTQIASDVGATAGNHQYSAYLLSASAGALPVTATSSVASTLTTGWTGAVLTFTAQPPAVSVPVWSLTQKSATGGATGSGSTVTGTLPAASSGTTTRPHLVVAALMGTNGTWSLPAGWVMGPTVLNGAAVRSAIAYYVDTTGGVGTSTTFTYSTSTANLRVWMAEYNPGADGVAITLNATGQAIAGAVDQCTVASGTAAAAGDLAVCSFFEHFSSGTAVTWTDPAGWVLIGSDGSSGSGNHLYSAYLLSAAGGALPVTGKSSAASTLTTGWAGTLATFTAAVPPPPGAPGLVGAFLNPSKYPGSLTLAQAIGAWEANSGRALTVRRVYYGLSGFPTAITADLQADAAAGRKVCLSFRPAFNPPSQTDLSGLDTFLSSCRNAGLVADVALWIEPYYEGLTAAQYIAGVQFYAPAIRQHYPLVFVTSGGSLNNNNENSYWPGDAYIDKVACDYYISVYQAGLRIGTGLSTDPALHADGASPRKPFGIWETNGSLDPTLGETQAQITEFYGYLQSYMAGRTAAGRDNADVLIFNSGQDANSTPIVTPDGGTSAYSPTPEFRNALYAALFDSASGTGVSLAVATTVLADGTVAVPYDQTLVASGGTLPYTWTVTAGALPAGLALSAGGEITGTPTAPGTASFTVTVTDAAALTASQALTLTVAPAPLAITTTSLPAAAAGTAYSQSLAAVNGTPPYTWAVIAGSIPPGLTLATGGLISGTPVIAGTWTFEVLATDAAAVTAAGWLAITVSGNVGRPVTPQFLAAITGSHQMAVRATALTTFQTGTSPTGTDITVLDGDVQLDGTAQVRGTLDLTTNGNGWDPRPLRHILQPYGTEIYVERGVAHSGSTEWIGLGYFKIYTVEQDTGPNSPLRISAQDRMASIVDARIPKPVTFAASTSVASVFTQLVTAVYPAAQFHFDWNADADKLGAAQTTQDDRYGFLAALATSRGKIMYFDYRGFLVVKDAPDVAAPAWTVGAGEGGVLVTAARTLDRDGVYNAIAATGEGASTTAPPFALAYDASPSSPTYWNGPFGQVPGFYSSPLITTAAQAQAAAASILRRTIGLPFAVDFTAVPNPAMQPYDPILVTYGPYASPETHVIMTITIPLTAAAALEATTREQGGLVVTAVDGLS